MKMERLKPIVINDEENGQEYTIEFNRASVMNAERKGFDISAIEKQPFKGIYDLFYFGFYMHHPKVTKQETDKLLDSLGGITNLPEGFIERLANLYVAPYQTIKNSSVTVQF